MLVRKSKDQREPCFILYFVRFSGGDSQSNSDNVYADVKHYIKYSLVQFSIY